MFRRLVQFTCINSYFKITYARIITKNTVVHTKHVHCIQIESHANLNAVMNYAE